MKFGITKIFEFHKESNGDVQQKIANCEKKKIPFSFIGINYDQSKAYPE